MTPTQIAYIARLELFVQELKLAAQKLDIHIAGARECDINVNDFISPAYPVSIPSFDEFTLNIYLWADDVTNRVNATISDRLDLISQISEATINKSETYELIDNSIENSMKVLSVTNFTKTEVERLNRTLFSQKISYRWQKVNTRLTDED